MITTTSHLGKMRLIYKAEVSNAIDVGEE